jgi:hypothetical protein
VAIKRLDAKIIRTYDLAKMFYRRVLILESIPLLVKVRLTALNLHLNPVSLRDSIDSKVARSWKIIQKHFYSRQQLPIVTFSFEVLQREEFQ